MTITTVPIQQEFSLYGVDDEVRDLVRRLQAQGYPPWWSGEAIAEPLVGVLAGTALPTPCALEKLRALARTLGETIATPRPGLTDKEIAAAREEAAALLYYPPAAYEDGVLVPGALPSHPWAVDEERCARVLGVIAALLRPGPANPTAIACETGVDRRDVYRAMDLLDAHPQWRREQRIILREWLADERSATETAVTLGAVSPDRLHPTNPARHARQRTAHPQEGATAA